MFPFVHLQHPDWSCFFSIFVNAVTKGCTNVHKFLWLISCWVGPCEYQSLLLHSASMQEIVTFLQRFTSGFGVGFCIGPPVTLYYTAIYFKNFHYGFSVCTNEGVSFSWWGVGKVNYIILTQFLLGLDHSWRTITVLGKVLKKRMHDIIAVSNFIKQLNKIAYCFPNSTILFSWASACLLILRQQIEQIKKNILIWGGNCRK